MAKSTVYTMVKLETFKEKTDRENIINYIRSLENVSETHEVYGTCDVILKVEAEDLDKIKETVEDGIRRNDKINSTDTMICFEGFKRDPKTGKIKEYTSPHFSE